MILDADPTYVAAATARDQERQRWMHAIRGRLEAHRERISRGLLLPADTSAVHRFAIEERVRGALDELASLCAEMTKDIKEINDDAS